ncbi:MAG: molybdopterin-dependent oxidoreductase [Nanoarchaeota archaeon]|nr:molybdopterin-dependent oxidoreductase [Nanoarchaeota archaeon]
MIIIRSICPYCGCGCYLNFSVKDKIKVSPIKEDPVSEGKPCIKGLTCSETINVDRIREPLIKINNKLKPVSWERAYKFIHDNLKKTEANEIAFIGGSPGSNEDNFLLQKFARDVFKTDNIDSCARICHAASCSAFKSSFGLTRMPSKMEDYEKADCILLIGTDPKITYPVAFNRILKAKAEGAKLICVEDIKNSTAKESDLFIEILDGTELAFLNGLLSLLVKNNKVKKEIPEGLKDILKHYTPKYISNICKAKESDILKVYKLIEKSKKFVLGFGMGLTQHSYGTDNVYSAINLVIAKNGKIIPMRGKTNIQGVSDMGCTPKYGGNTLVSFFTDKPAKAIYIMETNPAQSLPDLNVVHKKLKKMFLVLHTQYPNKTMEFADVVLPSCSWAEHSGTFTNGESRVRYFNKIINPLYKSKENWRIIKELAAYFGKNYSYNSLTDIWKDINKIDGYEKIRLSKLKNSIKGEFVDYKIKFERFNLVEFISLEEKISKEYPYVLTTERLKYQFCTGDRSSRSKTLNNLEKEPFCFINQKDADNLKLKNKDNSRIFSKSGEIFIKINIDNDVPPGLLSVPFHFKSCLVNKLFPLEIDPISKTANLKRVAVNIEKWD